MPVDRSKLNAALERAHEWLAMDPDPLTRREIQALLILHDRTPLLQRFLGELHFGTAGLRGLIGGGPTRMNLVTVAQATAGLARQLLADVENVEQRGVVVARDGRRKSPEFARVAAEVLAGHNIRVHWFEEPTPTPVAAFAGLHLSAAATVVVTASHNPPAYNGYKVFSERGSQIVPPQDERIRKERTAAFNVRRVPRRAFEVGLKDELIVPVSEALGEEYLKAIATQCVGAQPPPAPVKAVTTSLHGVGHPWLIKALAQRGFSDVSPVKAQQEPDMLFPTVRFPNPEEEGALDMALALARSEKADLVIANDPDADRLCVAEVDANSDTGYRVLSGNEVGVLLADWLLTERKKNKTLPKNPLVLASVVSSSMLARVAEAHKARCEFTLTGFKWLWDRALQLHGEAEFVFAYEEALGYCVGPAVRDKDGIGAAQAIIELKSSLTAAKSSLADRLDELSLAHGLHATRQVSITFDGAAGETKRRQIMAALRKDPPKEVGGKAIAATKDFQDEAQASAAGVPTANMLVWSLEGGGQVIVRPSGTEPKLKFYLEVVVPAANKKALGEARSNADTLLKTLAEWIQRTVGGAAAGAVIPRRRRKTPTRPYQRAAVPPPAPAAPVKAQPKAETPPKAAPSAKAEKTEVVPPAEASAEPTKKETPAPKDKGAKSATKKAAAKKAGKGQAKESKDDV